MRRPDLVADCASCAAVCCTATAFDASEDFAFDKPAGARCVNLARDGRCAIHDELAARGFAGCAIYDCHGAGPRVTRAFAGRGEEAAAERDAAFLVLRVVHELIWLLDEAARLCPVGNPVAGELASQIAILEAIAAGPASAPAGVDLAAHEAAARAVLRRVGTALGGRRRVRLPLAARSERRA